jgi:hypothetical protein
MGDVEFVVELLLPLIERAVRDMNENERESQGPRSGRVGGIDAQI